MTSSRNVKAAAYVLCSCVFGVIFMRLVVYLAAIPTDTYTGELISSVVFALPVQLVFFLAVPFCIYKFYGKRTVRETLAYSSLGKFSPWFLLAVPIGIAVYFMTVSVSSAWTNILRLTGYTVPAGSPDKPATFNGGMFALEVLLTAALPAVCEEFCIRGGLLTEARGKTQKLTVVILFGIIFGLFHQNIRQVFYTSLFGAFAAYIVIETDSLYPAMLMHFTNNFLSVYLDYAADYGFFGGGIFGMLGSMPPWVVAVMLIVTVLFAAALTVLMLFFAGKREQAPQKSAELPCAACGGTAASVRDYALAIAVGVVAALTTLFTYIWGFYY